MPLVSVVIPAYNEAAVLPLFYPALRDALAPLESRARFEFLFVNNGSTDGTLEVLRDLHATDRRVNVITLSRNFGYQAAITAGLTLARGDAVACIDADGEDPPAVLAHFVETWLAGDAEIVYGIRGKRPESALMQFARRAFYRVTRAIADHDIVLDMAEFGLLDRRAKEAVLSTRSTFPFVRSQVGYVGFRRVGIPYDRAPRLGGGSHYNLVRAMKFGIAGIVSASTFPLRMLAYGGTVLLPACVIAGTVALLRSGTSLGSFGVLIALVLVLSVWSALGIGIIAIYVARIYKDQVGLPLYIVDRPRSFLEDPDDR